MLEIQLPSGRTDVRIEKTFTLDKMASLHNAQKYTLPEVFVKTLQHFTNVDLKEMLLEDFRYFIAMFEKSSWPDSHRSYEWRCTTPYYLDMRHNIHFVRPQRKKFVEVPCNKLNTEEIARQQIQEYPWREMPAGYKHPTVAKWIEHFTLIEEYGEKIAEAAMWLDSDVDLKTTLKHSSLSEILGAGKYAFRICALKTVFKCNHCMRVYETIQPFEILNHLRTYSDQSMMNMTLDLAASNNIYVPDDAPLMKLLYWYSCYIKDLNNAKEERAKQLSLKRGRR